MGVVFVQLVPQSLIPKKFSGVRWNTHVDMTPRARMNELVTLVLVCRRSPLRRA